MEKKLNPWRKKNPLINSLIIGICALGLFLVIIMFLTCEGGVFAILLGTGSKKETIEFIAFGIGGLLAVMGAIAINDRARAQNRIADAQVENNKLVEKGHVNERFKSAIENLGRENQTARISAFYQLYYLAKGQQDMGFKNSIFEILCAHLRNLTQEKSYQEETGKDVPTEECKTLLTLLFGPTKETVFGEMQVNLKNVYLKGANLKGVNFWASNLSGANFENVEFQHANLSFANLKNAILTGANFENTNLHYTVLRGANLENTIFIGVNFRGLEIENAHSIKGADFRWATMDGEPIAQKHLPDNKGEYYADWNPPPEKEEN